MATDSIRDSIIESLETEADRLQERLLRSEGLNAELARMLAEWIRETDDAGHYCCGVQCDDGTEHSTDCLAGQTIALLKKARTE